MPAQDDREYFLRRAREERDIANRAEDNAVVLAHLRMAETYECRARELEHDSRGMPATVEIQGVALQ